MISDPFVTFQHAFAALDDPRMDRTKAHRLLDVVVIAICAVICGADSWVAIEEFGKAKHHWAIVQHRFCKSGRASPGVSTLVKLLKRKDRLCRLPIRHCFPW